MHTKEPWVVGESMQFGVFHVSVDETCEFAPRSLALTGVIGDLDHEESVANARRIVACVNACAGIPTELLEKDLISPDKAIVIKEQRDELLAAAKKIRPFIEEGEVPECFWSEPFKSALADFDEALAKCES